MPITVNWDDDQQTVIRLDYADPIKAWPEYVEAVRESYALASAKLYRVDIIHAAGRTRMPPGSALPWLRRASKGIPQNIGLMVAIIDDPFARLIVPLVYKTLPNSEKLKYVRSLDQARALIANSRPHQST